MVRKSIFLMFLLLGGFLQTLSAQVIPVVSTIGSEIWYNIESAAVTATGAPDATVTGILPMATKGYVLYSPTAAGFAKYRLTTGTDDEQWAIVNIAGTQYLKNKGTGLFLVSSHSVGNSSTDAFIFTSLGSNQFTIRNNSQTSVAVAWNSFTLNRFSTFGLNTTTAWVFKAVTPVVSTVSNPIWYTVESAAVTALGSPDATLTSILPLNNKGYVLYSPATAGKIMYRVSTGTDDEKWAIVGIGGNKYLLNKSSGLYMRGSHSVGNYWMNDSLRMAELVSGQYSLRTSVTETDNSTTQINSYTIAWNSLTCDRWSSAQLNTNTAWIFKSVPPTTPMSITSIAVNQGRLVTGKGNTNFAVTYFAAQVFGFTGVATLESIRMSLTGTTNLTDIDNLRIYKLDVAKFNPTTATLIGTGTIASGDITVTLTSPLALVSGTNNFCVVVDVKETATEGNLVDASVSAMKLVGTTEQLATTPSPANAATIFLTQSILFTPGDYNSVSYRIPAIVTAKDGSLVTSTDKRNNGSGDLPSNIDQYVRRSTDNGKTWSDVLMTCGNGISLGYGDPALVVDRVTGKIICLVVNDKGFFGSTASAPIRVISTESDDNGITWSAPKDITNQLYGTSSTNPATVKWAGMFISSGRGLQLRSGRIMFAGVVRDGVNSGIQVHSVYTDDLGQTWHTGTASAVVAGDESKFAERNNGDVIVSIRNAGKREWNVSTNKGLSWGTATQHADLTDPNCNGEIMTYTSTLDGYNKNRMLHSLCYAGNRTNVSMLLSYNEGVTFPIRKTICAGSSAYSTFTILPDGTIGMYFEDGSTGNTYDMIFVRFSLNWLTGGTDSFVALNPSEITKTEQKKIEAKSLNGRIIVTGTNADYAVYNSIGTQVLKTSKLMPGMYILKLDNQTLKVLVN